MDSRERIETARSRLSAWMWMVRKNQTKEFREDVEVLMRNAMPPPDPPGGNWFCRCGHTNGPNLAHCASCERRPNEII